MPPGTGTVSDSRRAGRSAEPCSPDVPDRSRETGSAAPAGRQFYPDGVRRPPKSSRGPDSLNATHRRPLPCERVWTSRSDSTPRTALSAMRATRRKCVPPEHEGLVAMRWQALRTILVGIAALVVATSCDAPVATDTSPNALDVKLIEPRQFPSPIRPVVAQRWLSAPAPPPAATRNMVSSRTTVPTAMWI